MAGDDRGRLIEEAEKLLGMPRELTYWERVSLRQMLLTLDRVMGMRPDYSTGKIGRKTFDAARKVSPAPDESGPVLLKALREFVAEAHHIARVKGVRGERGRRQGILDAVEILDRHLGPGNRSWTDFPDDQVVALLHKREWMRQEADTAEGERDL